MKRCCIGRCNTFASVCHANFSRGDETVSRKCFHRCNTSATVLLMEARSTEDLTVAQMWEHLSDDAHDSLLWSSYLNPPGPGYYFQVENVGTDLTDGPGVWIAVNSRDLPCPVRLRLRRGRGGKVAVTGLVVGERGETEITSETLRAIKLADITAALFDHFDPASPPAEPDRATWSGKPEDYWIAQGEWMSYWLFKELVYDAATEMHAARVESAELEAFARVYARHLASQPHRAMTATADELHISRATANRRVRKCRELGLLPSQHDGEGRR